MKAQGEAWAQRLDQAGRGCGEGRRAARPLRPRAAPLGGERAAPGGPPPPQPAETPPRGRSGLPPPRAARARPSEPPPRRAPSSGRADGPADRHADRPTCAAPRGECTRTPPGLRGPGAPAPPPAARCSERSDAPTAGGPAAALRVPIPAGGPAPRGAPWRGAGAPRWVPRRAPALPAQRPPVLSPPPRPLLTPRLPYCPQVARPGPIPALASRGEDWNPRSGTPCPRTLFPLPAPSLQSVQPAQGRTPPSVTVCRSQAPGPLRCGPLHSSPAPCPWCTHASYMRALHRASLRHTCLFIRPLCFC